MCKAGNFSGMTREDITNGSSSVQQEGSHVRMWGASLARPATAGTGRRDRLDRRHLFLSLLYNIFTVCGSHLKSSILHDKGGIILYFTNPSHASFSASKLFTCPCHPNLRALSMLEKVTYVSHGSGEWLDRQELSELESSHSPGGPRP